MWFSSALARLLVGLIVDAEQSKHDTLRRFETKRCPGFELEQPADCRALWAL